MKGFTLATAGALCALASAQAPASPYGQCGGQGWQGTKACVAGYSCYAYNSYYSQCVPATSTAAVSAAASTTAAAASAPSSCAAKKAKRKSKSKRSHTAREIAAMKGYPHAMGSNFMVGGKQQYLAGSNSYWIGFLTDDADIDKTMSDFAATGMKILRVWGFNDVNTIPGAGTVYYQALVKGSDPVINTGADGLQRMDLVVAAAEKYKVKLIINFVNNWNDYGGMNAYVQYYGLSDNTAWFNNTAAQTQYRKYISTVVGRYSSSHAIFAWELANEPRCHGCATSILTNWATITSKYIKSLDPYHMVTLGDEGFGLPGDGSYPYTYAEGVDWATNLNIPSLDYATLHLYPTSWGVSPTNTWGDAWIKAHGALCAKAGKPCVLEEYGVPTTPHCSVEGEWQNTSLATAGMAADQYWQFGDTLSNGQTANDGYTIYPGSSDFTCLVTNHHAAIKTHNAAMAS